MNTELCLRNEHLAVFEKKGAQCMLGTEIRILIPLFLLPFPLALKKPYSEANYYLLIRSEGVEPASLVPCGVLTSSPVLHPLPAAF